MALLAVSELRLEAGGDRRDSVTLLEDVQFELAAGRSLCLVGESGSGKTLTALSVLGMLPNGVRRASGSIRFGDQDLTNLTPRQLRTFRGGDIGMVFQDPLGHLDPAFTVGSQMVETIRSHTEATRREARERAADLLDRVGIAQPARRMRDHPHQLSGGMAQRVMIALAIACQPRLLIADEPTTALDVTVQAQILDLLRSLQEEQGMALLLISHDLSVVAEMADDVAVLYAGQVVEQGEVTDLFLRPNHPYTEALLGAQPGATPKSPSERKQPLTAIPGSVPGPGSWPEGCRFHPRCRHATEACDGDAPVLLEASSPASGRRSRCLLTAELTLLGVGAAEAPDGDGETASDASDRTGEAIDATAVTDVTAATNAGDPVLLDVEDLGRDYVLKDGTLPWSRSRLQAVDNVSFQLRAGETLGLVGESGAGKSTVGRMVLGLEPPSRGRVVIDGTDLTRARRQRRRELRRDVQVVFQDPHSSLDPLMTVGATLAEPLEVHTDLTRADIRSRVAELLDQVGLDPDLAQRHPRVLSGGQRQRVAIARAIALEPRLIVCDEPVSALDVSTQAQVINLLMELQRDLGVAYLFIGHDLAVVHQISDHIAVMQGGQIVERGPADAIYHDPQHSYTAALIDAVLPIDPRQRRPRGHDRAESGANRSPTQASK